MDLKDSRRLPAFPTGIDTDQAGMTLRDWFATQALIGLLGHKTDAACGGHFPSDNGMECPVVVERVKNAYEYADAMLRERAK